jgi:hypothetical protein
MSTLFKGLFEHAGKYIPTIMPSNVQVNSMYLGQVLDVITGEHVQEYVESGDAQKDGISNQDLYRYIGAIVFKEFIFDSNRYEDQVSRFAYPLDKGSYRLPLAGELVLLVGGFININGLQKKAYYYTNVVTGYRPTRNAVRPGAVTRLKKITAPDPLDVIGTDPSELLSKRFEKRTYHQADSINKDGLVVPTMREGDKIIEGRFGGTIRFTSTMTTKGVWPDESLIKGSNDGDPFLVIKNTKWSDPVEGQDASQNTLVDDDINTDMSSIYINTSQNVPLIVKTSKTIYSWGFEIERSDAPKPIEDPTARFQSFFSDTYDPNFQLSVTADVPFQVGAFDDNGDGAKVGGPVQAIPPSAASTALEKVVVEALNLSFAFGETHGKCARGTYNHARNLVQRLRGQPGTQGMGIAAGGNANSPGYFRNLVALGYTQYNQGVMDKATLGGILKNGPAGAPWGVGDVVTYWSNDGAADSSYRMYGHTQMYAGKLLGVGNWTTDNKYNYGGSSFVYSSKPPNSWNLIIWKAPQA